MLLRYRQLVRQVAEPFKLSYGQAQAIVITGGGLLVTGVLMAWSYLLPWSPLLDVGLLATMTLLGWLALSLFAKHRATPASDEFGDEVEADPEMTMELSIVGPDSEWLQGRPHVKARELIRGDDGEQYLVLRSIDSFRPKTWRRKQYRVVTHRYRLDNSPLVDPRLAHRPAVKPVEGEEAIYCLSRLHWFSHGPKQILIALLAVLVVAGGGVIDIGYDAFGLPRLVLVLTVSAILGWLALEYFRVWMKWAYRYLIITNRRVMLIYDPPFNLPGEEPYVLISAIKTTHPEDQSWWGNWLGYGIIQADTAADKGDEWINEGVRYVRRGQEVSNKLSALQLAINRPPETVAQREDQELQNEVNRRLLTYLEEQGHRPSQPE